MIAKWIFFLISFVLAVSHYPSSIPPIFATFNEKIAPGDINALQSIISTNRILFKSPFIKSFRNGGFLLAVQEDRAPVVEFLLKNANVNAAARNNVAIRLASANGNYDIVRLLLERPEVNPGAENDEAIITALKNGHTEIVRMLLTLSEVDPGAMKNEALIKATRNGHIEVVRLLLAHPKVDPTIGGGRAVILASSRNHALLNFSLMMEGLFHQFFIFIH